ncbi:histidine kinase [Spirosoma sp. KNUC1025]|uniref:histidine kinase n=1 Tax=Spirosoma sp. KNUC1025 TaxID=2894082 RepID=UPI00386541C0|nr:histidine kinase [Spirosoma sp. KNUC1025]
MIFGLWLMGLTALAQAGLPPVVFNGQPVTEQGLDIRPYSQFFPDSSSNPDRSLAWVRKQHFYRFKPGLRYRWDVSTDWSRQQVWLRFSITNTHPTDSVRLYAHAGVHADITLYELSRTVPANISRAGFLWRWNSHPLGPLALPVIVPPRTTHHYYIRVVNFVRTFDEFKISLFTRQDFKLWNASWVQIAVYLFGAMAMMLGCFLLMGTYTFYQYFLNQDRAFLYYALYASTAFVWVVKMMNSRFGLGLISAPYSLLNHPNLPSLSFSIGIFYALFLLKILDLPARQPKFTRLIRGLVWVLVGQQALSFVQAFGGWLFASNFYYLFQDVPNILTGALLIVATARSRSPLKPYLLTGGLALYLITFFPLHGFFRFYGLTPVEETFIYYPPFFMSVGMVIDLFCFALALAYRSRLVEVERNQMQTRHARDLEIQLVQRSQEIQEQSRLLEAQHIRQLETEFEQKLADTEMTALRAQMNPHFIFNCLNSIKLYTLQNDADKASDYLTKFSRLIRLVLENSRSELVPLQSELEALQLYIELEAMRFKQKVQFSIHVAPRIDQRFLCIPPLLLQPYVENAIWHGLMHKSEGGTVSVEVSQPEDSLLHIEITDDGVGRERAAELKSKSAGKHKSFGMQVTADRIRMINQLYNIQTQTQIVDMMDSFGEPCGTRVILEIPV